MTALQSHADATPALVRVLTDAGVEPFSVGLDEFRVSLTLGQPYGKADDRPLLVQAAILLGLGRDVETTQSGDTWLLSVSGVWQARGVERVPVTLTVTHRTQPTPEPVPTLPWPAEAVA